MSQSTDTTPLPSKGQAGADPYSIPLDEDRRLGLRALRDRHALGILRAPAQGGSGPLLRGRATSGRTGRSRATTTSSHVEKNPEIFSSARSIVVGDPDPDFPLEAGFITMDGARHEAHRKVVQPVAVAAQPRLARAADPRARRRDPRRASGRRDLRLGRSRLDRAHHRHARHPVRLPLRAAPQAHLWSDMATASPTLVGAAAMTGGAAPGRAHASASRSSRRSGRSAQNRPPTERLDFVTALANARGDARTSSRMEYLGTLILLIVGGNDTTRNSISGGVLALNENPDEYAEAARRPGSDPEHGERDHPLADAARAHAPHGDAATRSSPASGSRRATRSSCGTCPPTATRTSSSGRTSS